MSPHRSLRLCDDLAPTFAGLPGLVKQVWLANREAGTFGGVYLWEDRQAMERFRTADLFRAVATHPRHSSRGWVSDATLDTPSLDNSKVTV